MKKFQVPFHLVENGACCDMLPNVSAETKYQAGLIVTGKYVVCDGTDPRDQQTRAYVDYDGIREVIDL